MTVLSLDAREAFAAALGDVFEHSPWVAEGVAAGRPFHAARALHDALMRRLRDAAREAQMQRPVAVTGPPIGDVARAVHEGFWT